MITAILKLRASGLKGEAFSRTSRGHGHGRCSRLRRACRRAACGLLLSIVAMAGLIHPARAAVSGPEAQVMGQASIEPRLGERIPLDIEFQNASGETVKLRHVLRERPVILHLVYFECPMLCKLSSDGLLHALDRLNLDAGEEFDVVTLSFDPREGTELAARARRWTLERYARSSAADGWHFLTGSPENIEQLTDAVGFHAIWDEATAQFAHPAGVFVLSSDGMVSRYLSGIEFRPRDLRLAIVEASEGQVSSVSDRLLMLCYQYDPATGRYGFAIMSALRASGVFTVAVLVGAIVVMIRRERRKKAGDRGQEMTNDEVQMTNTET